MGFIQMKLPKRIRHKIENSKRNRDARANHEEWLQSQGLDTHTLKQRTKKFKGYDIPKYEPDPNQPFWISSTFSAFISKILILSINSPILTGTFIIVIFHICKLF